GRHADVPHEPLGHHLADAAHQARAEVPLDPHERGGLHGHVRLDAELLAVLLVGRPAARQAQALAGLDAEQVAHGGHEVALAGDDKLDDTPGVVVVRVDHPFEHALDGSGGGLLRGGEGGGARHGGRRRRGHEARQRGMGQRRAAVAALGGGAPTGVPAQRASALRKRVDLAELDDVDVRGYVGFTRRSVPHARDFLPREMLASELMAERGPQHVQVCGLPVRREVSERYHADGCIGDVHPFAVACPAASRDPADPPDVDPGRRGGQGETEEEAKCRSRPRVYPSGMAPKLMLDSHVADALLAEPTLKAKLDALQAAGVIELVKTYVQDAEHDATPEATKPGRAQALRSAFSKVDETAQTLFVLDRPNLDVALFGGPDEHALYDDVHQDNAKYIDDGIIAATALTTCNVLV